jgi:hypothetical protein
VLASLFVPYKSTTVPEWKLEVTDEAGKPISGITVMQQWQYIDLDIAPWVDVRSTDVHGQVFFPRRVVWASLATRLFIGDGTTRGPTGPSLFFQACDAHWLREGKLFWSGNRFCYHGPREMESRIEAKPVEQCHEIG